jgi:hypothetical protein
MSESDESRVARAFGLKAFGARSRDIETEPGKTESIYIKMFWVATYYIHAFVDKRIVGVMHTDTECRGIYLPPVRMGEKEPHIKPVILTDWSDPVIGALKSINVVPTNDKLWWGDGFSFDLHLITSADFNTKISVWNTMELDPTMEWLWDSITETAEKLYYAYDAPTQQLFHRDDDYSISGDMFQE